ncbi:MAG TPA: hypothetical protein VM531_00560 [Sphingomicrobium sp.]|nr:hypothetical protein [Sphingomicrobium sp.]
MTGKMWRYPVYLLAIIAVLMGCYWLFLLTAPRGWGGRSELQIVLFATLLLIIPAATALIFGCRAILAAQEGRARKAAVSVIVGVGAVPIAWVITIYAHSRGMLPF